jgi:hydrogenase nickel incorporation protein HypA/HybF
MHEVGIMQTALEAATEAAYSRGAKRIHRLTLHVGRQAGVVAEALAFAFAALAPGTPAEGAELVLETMPAVCHCAACRVEFQPPGDVFACPSCGRLSSDLRQGRELALAAVEVS